MIMWLSIKVPQLNYKHGKSWTAFNHDSPGSVLQWFVNIRLRCRRWALQSGGLVSVMDVGSIRSRGSFVVVSASSWDLGSASCNARSLGGKQPYINDANTTMMFQLLLRRLQDSLNGWMEHWFIKKKNLFSLVDLDHLSSQDLPIFIPAFNARLPGASSSSPLPPNLH